MSKTTTVGSILSIALRLFMLLLWSLLRFIEVLAGAFSGMLKTLIK